MQKLLVRHGRSLDPDEDGGEDPLAARAIAARDRQRLEQLCRYLCRPPIAQQRLELLSDGRVPYTMKGLGATVRCRSCSSPRISSHDCLAPPG